MKQLPKRGSADYFKIIGLLTIAAAHCKEQEMIERSICEIVGERFEDRGHVSDAIYSPYDADELLDKLRAKRAYEEKRKSK